MSESFSFSLNMFLYIIEILKLQNPVGHLNTLKEVHISQCRE